MKAGILLIALGFGYKILADALKEKGWLKTLGVLIGAVMIVTSAVGTACIVSCVVQGKAPAMGKRMCPMVPPPAP